MIVLILAMDNLDLKVCNGLKNRSVLTDVEVNLPQPLVGKCTYAYMNRPWRIMPA